MFEKGNCKLPTTMPCYLWTVSSAAQQRLETPRTACFMLPFLRLPWGWHAHSVEFYQTTARVTFTWHTHPGLLFGMLICLSSASGSPWFELSLFLKQLSPGLVDWALSNKWACAGVCPLGKTSEMQQAANDCTFQNDLQFSPYSWLWINLESFMAKLRRSLVGARDPSSGFQLKNTRINIIVYFSVSVYTCIFSKVEPHGKYFMVYSFDQTHSEQN